MPLLPLGDSGSLRLGRCGCHDPVDPGQCGHRALQQEAAGSADEAQGLEDQADERSA